MGLVEPAHVLIAHHCIARPEHLKQTRTSPSSIAKYSMKPRSQEG